jgi:hypothetical protein
MRKCDVQDKVEDDSDKENSMEYILEEDASLLEAINAGSASQTHEPSGQQAAQNVDDKVPHRGEGESLDERLAKFR